MLWLLNHSGRILDAQLKDAPPGSHWQIGSKIFVLTQHDVCGMQLRKVGPAGGSGMLCFVLGLGGSADLVPILEGGGLAESR